MARLKNAIRANMGATANSMGAICEIGLRRGEDWGELRHILARRTATKKRTPSFLVQAAKPAASPASGYRAPAARSRRRQYAAALYPAVGQPIMEMQQHQGRQNEERKRHIRVLPRAQVDEERSAEQAHSSEQSSGAAQEKVEAAE